MPKRMKMRTKKRRKKMRPHKRKRRKLPKKKKRGKMRQPSVRPTKVRLNVVKRNLSRCRCKLSNNLFKMRKTKLLQSWLLLRNLLPSRVK
jgi:hypothetical protein